MNLIHLTGCDKCQPEKWKKGEMSIGNYWCIKCKRVITYILERKKEAEK